MEKPEAGYCVVQVERKKMRKFSIL